MSMSWDTIILQLGIAGLIVYVGFRIAMFLISTWAKGDADRTVAITDGFRAIVDSHSTWAQAVADSHERVITTMTMHQQHELAVLQDQAVAIAELNQKVETALDLTPVRGIPRADPRRRVIIPKDPEPDAREPDRASPRAPRAASSPGTYGPILPIKK